MYTALFSYLSNCAFDVIALNGGTVSN